MALILTAGGVALKGHHETTDFKGLHVAEIQKSGSGSDAITTASHPQGEMPANTQVSTFLLGTANSTRKRMSSSLLLSKSSLYLSQVEPSSHPLQGSLGNVVFNLLVSECSKIDGKGLDGCPETMADI